MAIAAVSGSCAAKRPLWSRSTMTSQAATQTNPAEPIARNVVRQPRLGASCATTIGVRTAPTAAPELKMPLPRLRSRGGKIRAVTRSAAGQLNDSPTPKQRTARDQPAQARRKRGRDGRQRPPRHRGGIGEAHTPAVNQITRRHLKERIRHHECREHPAKTVEIGDRERLADLLSDECDRLPVHVIEDRRGEHEPADSPGPRRGAARKVVKGRPAIVPARREATPSSLVASAAHGPGAEWIPRAQFSGPAYNARSRMPLQRCSLRATARCLRMAARRNVELVIRQAVRVKCVNHLASGPKKLDQE